MASELHGVEPKMDPANLYREEVFTDRRVGSIRVLTPVKPDGTIDSTRKVVYVGETEMLTPGGMLPIAFDLEASSLAQAVEKFGDGVKEAIERTVRQLQDLRREAASSIVVPDRMPGGLIRPGGSGGQGGMPR